MSNTLHRMTSLRRRIEKVEAAVVPKPEARWELVFKPDEDTGTEEEWDAFHQKMAEIRSKGHRATIVSFVKAPVREEDPGE
jgi:hypothetical protein